MKIIVYLLAVLLTALILLQNMGGRYGSFALLSWCWLLISLTPILIGVYQKREFAKSTMGYLILLIIVVLVQPILKIHPILVLLCSMIIVVPYIIFSITKKDKLIEILELKINEQAKVKCRNLLINNKYEDCFNTLLQELENEEDKGLVYSWMQRWNQVKKDEIRNVDTKESLDRRQLKIADEIMKLLK